MAGQLIPPPGFEPKVPADATPEQCIRMWVDLMDACEQFLLARLREEIGGGGDRSGDGDAGEAGCRRLGGGFPG